ncbi:MAG: hypothetical protein ACI89S_001198, partial [Gammaproteobacteria bacterium]
PVVDGYIDDSSSSISLQSNPIALLYRQGSVELDDLNPR